ncbi:MAG: S8 family serine peptidase [Bacteroidales bacterium]|nr:S8 family serine peptidase [Bacteroidales bacterium]
MNIYLKFLFTIVLLYSINSHSQEAFKPYQDGKIYFKLKDDARLTIPVNSDKTVNYQNIAFIAGLDRSFQIKAMSRPFDINNDPKLLCTYLLEFNNFKAVDVLINKLKAMDFIEYAEKAPRHRLLYTPNDPYFNSTQGDYNINWYLDKLRAEEVWDITKGSASVKIAIVDNAIWTSHEDLQGKIVAQYDAADKDNDANPPYSTNNTVRQDWTHGTHVAGLAGAVSDNNKGIASIGFNCSLIAVKAAPNATGYLDYVYDAINWAANNGADIINMSVGDPGANTSTGQNIINAAAAKGIILVAAAGNDGLSQVWYPAGYSNVMSVGSTDDDDKLSSFSQYGSWVNFAAPGGITKSPTQSFEWSLISTTYSSNLIDNFCEGYYNAMKGTSMAAPIVSGFCGLIKSLDKNITQAQIKQCIQQTADPLKGGKAIGGGRLNALKTLNCLGFYHSPIINWSVNTPLVVEGNSVQFTDLSTHIPTAWEWTFEGGTPANSTAQNPLIKYNTAGKYKVTLKATNQGGSATVTKEQYITVIQPATSCDTLAYPYTGNLMCSELGTNKGYVAGNNTYNDKSKANYIDNYGGMTKITGALVIFGAASGTGNFDFAVWDNSGTGGNPGAIIGKKTVAISSIQTQKYTYIEFDTPIAIKGPFYMGMTNMPTYPTGKIAFMHSKIGVAHPGLNIGWEQYSDNIWKTYLNFYGDMTNWIFPVVCPDVISKAPVADFIADKTSININDFVKFTDKSKNEPTSYYWEFPGGEPTSSTSKNPTIQYNTSGKYNVSLTVSNANGSDTEIKTDYITVLSNEPIADFKADKTEITASETVVFSDLSLSNPDSWEWSFDGGNPSNSTEQNPTVQYNTPGKYNVTLKVTNSYGENSKTKEAYITVNEHPVVCDTLHKAGFNNNKPPLCCICGAKNGCVGGNNKTGDISKADFFFNINPVKIAGVEIYFGYATNASGTNPNVKVTLWNNYGTDGAPGDIIDYATVPLTTIMNDITNKVPTFVSFPNKPLITEPFYAGVQLPDKKGDTIVMMSTDYRDPYAVPNGVGTAWEQWDDKKWVAINDHQTNWSYMDGSTQKWMQISFAIFPVACPFEDFIKVNSTPSRINIFPNPAKDMLNIDFGKTKIKNCEIGIYDLTGRLKKSQKILNPASFASIKLEGLSEGIYLLKIVSKDGFNKVSRFSLMK